VPELAALGGIVWMFLRYLNTRDKESKSTTSSQLGLVADCVDKIAITHERTIDSLDRNTDMCGQVNTRLDQLTELERKRLGA
jgi:hypothetical protein